MDDIFTPIDACSREYPNVPLWCRISEGYGNFPQLFEERLSYEQIHDFVQNYVVGNIPITKETALKFDMRKDNLRETRNRMLAEINGEKKKKVRKPRKYQPDPLLVEYVSKYLISHGCCWISKQMGRHKDTVRKVAQHLGYQFIGASAKGGHWIAPRGAI